MNTSHVMRASLVMAACCVLNAVFTAPARSAGSPACPGDNGGLSLSPGFCANVFADNLGHIRHMAFSDAGVLYVNTWSGEYYDNDKVPDGGFLIALQDTKKA